MIRTVFEKYMTDCPYLDRRKWAYSAFRARSMSPGVYEKLLNYGWRRSGNMFYQNCCSGCFECVPLRIDIDSFRESRSQRRVLKRNSDIILSMNDSVFSRDEFELYNLYARKKHGQKISIDRALFTELFITSPIDTRVIRYYAGPELLGAAWVDIMPDSVSSVYFAFNPFFSARSPGVFSILKQIELCRILGKSKLHLGFYVENSRKMNYKRNFRPYELLEKDGWREYCS